MQERKLVFLPKFLSEVDKKTAESFSYERRKGDWVSQTVCSPSYLLVSYKTILFLKILPTSKFPVKTQQTMTRTGKLALPNPQEGEEKNPSESLSQENAAVLPSSLFLF